MLTQSLLIAQISDPIARFAGTAFKVEEQDDGVITITAPFYHIYGDPIVLYLSTQSDGSILITDNGETREWLNEFKEHDAHRKLGPITFEFWLLGAELFETQIGEGHDLMVLTSPNDIPGAVFRLLQTIMHISGLGMVDDD